MKTDLFNGLPDDLYVVLRRFGNQVQCSVTVQGEPAPGRERWVARGGKDHDEALRLALTAWREGPKTPLVDDVEDLL